MPYVNSHGVRIHYEVEGQGPPLVLQHGFSSNLKTWSFYGYMKELKGDYLLILLDARGHGDSDKPHDPQAYGPEMMTGDVVAVLNDLGVEKANYWGYSMGAWIGFQLIRYHPSRFSSYILGGTSLYSRQSETQKQLPNLIDTMLKFGIEKGPEAAIAFREKTLGRVASDEIKQRMRNNDYKALYALRQNRSERPTADNLLTLIAVPCLLYAGERDAVHDSAEKAAKHVTAGNFISIPGLNHLETYERCDPILPHAKKFLSRVTS